MTKRPHLGKIQTVQRDDRDMRPPENVTKLDGFDHREACAFWTWKISTRLVLIVLGVAAVLATNDFFGVFTR